MLELRLNNQCIATTDQASAAPAAVQEWQAVEFACVPPAGASLVLTLAGVVQTVTLAPFLRPGDPAWHWMWNPQNTTGQFTLTLQATAPDGSVETLHTTLDVVPGKIDQQRYAWLLEDIQRLAHGVAYALAYSSAGATLLAPLTTDEPPGRSLLEEYCSFYEQRIGMLERVVTQLARQHGTTLRPQQERILLEQTRDLASVDVAALGRSLAMQAQDVVQRQSTATADTYENRVLKHVLNECWRRLHAIATAAAHQAESGQHSPILTTIAERSRTLARRLQALRSVPFLADVGMVAQFHGPTHAMRHNPLYRQVYQCWQELRQYPTLTVASPLFQLPIHDLPLLYESWCVLQVAAILLELPDGEVQQQHLFTGSSPGATASQQHLSLTCTLALTADTPMLVLDWQEWRLRLRYHPRYRPFMTSRPTGDRALGSLDRHTHVPDLALECERPGHPPALLVLDAKYRLDAQGGVPADALADAYTYLGGIGLPTGTRATQAAVLLYPGTGAAEHYASGTGAIPLLPDAVPPFRDWLIGWLTSDE